MIHIGEKIRTLRKRKNLSQEQLAEQLGVSFQAVSKWENGTTMPDISLVPAIAFLFGVSTDELFDFNRYETERQVEEICNNAYRYRQSEPSKAEQILRDGLKRFPGNDIILNNLLYTLDQSTRADEVIDICRALIESTNDDAVKYDACRILASCYMECRKPELAEQTLEMIPEIYFTKLELAASMLDGERRYEAAQKQKNLSAETLVDMLVILGRHFIDNGMPDKAAIQLKAALAVIDAFKDDFLEDRYFKATIYEYSADARAEITELLSGL